MDLDKIQKLSSYERYVFSMKEIVDSKELWTIVDIKGDIALSVIDDKRVVSLWAYENFIESNIEGAWEECFPFKIKLEDFDNLITSLILENDYLINIFPINGMSGFVVSINEFIRDLKNNLT